MDESEHILISLEHRHVARILSGAKKVELRRRPLKVSPGTYIWMYSKVPHAAVGAVARVGTIASAAPEDLWHEYGSMTGIAKCEFDAYFVGVRVGWAILLDEVRPLPRAVTLAALRRQSDSFHPPQFFMRLRQGSHALEILRRGFECRAGTRQRCLAF